ncbi:hypothetical protein [Winogradskyella sp.]|uniref:hypothetical protein n=1 Tax=Winogradskyella sp. TaxID=1883156 RepID=UPI003BAB5CDD
MKTKFVTLAIILFSFILHSQNNDNEEIIIDFQTMNTTSNNSKLLNPIDYGKFYSFQIDNVNKFLYQVTIVGNSISLDTPVPTELQRLFRLSGEELEQTTEQEAADDAAQEAADATSSMKANLSVFSKTLETSINKNNKKAFKMQQDINDLAKRGRSTKSKEQEAEALKEFTMQQLDLKSEVDDLLKKMDDFSDELSNLLDEIYTLKVVRVKLINLATRNVSYLQMQKDLEDDSSLKPKNPNFDFNNLASSLKQLKAEMEELKPKLGAEQVIQLDNTYKKNNEAYAALDKSKALIAFSQVDYLYGELKNKNNFIAKAPPIQANGDLVNFEVTITPTRTHELGSYKNPITYSFDVPVKGGLKVDFSVGPTFAFGDGALDEKYFFESTDTENMGILKERDNNNILNPGVAAMMHYYRRSGKNMSWGGLFGVGAGFQSIDDVNLSFYGGISFVLGKEQKIMLNTGVVFMNVDRLKKGQFEVDNTYDTTEVSLSDVTEKVFKGSFFISISYNLANRVEN